MSEPPGYWHEDRRGRKYWIGPRFWTATFGSSTIEYMTDRPLTAIDCFLPDASRGTVICALQGDTVDDPQWLRPLPDGGAQAGKLDVSASGLCFAETPPRADVASMYRLHGPPGRYVPVPGRVPGARRWQGPSISFEMHGAAVVEMACDSARVVHACHLPDGRRGSVFTKMTKMELREGRWEEIGPRWRRLLPDGSWNDGDVEITATDVRFIDGPSHARRQIGSRSADDAPDLEADLMASPRIAELVKDIWFATDLYRAMCNTEWHRNGHQWAATWRHAAGIVATLRDLNEGYLDFYCSDDEGTVSDDVAAELAALGWGETV
ncbi:MAG TPA: hypothetical protein VMQ73_26675 [Methylomirabilota bacterium]|nr:hypothetical protein [Methylomirabilota bacterium]